MKNSLLALWTSRSVAQSISEARVAIQRPGTRGSPTRKRAGQGSCRDRPGENCWKSGTFSMQLRRPEVRERALAGRAAARRHPEEQGFSRCYPQAVDNPVDNHV